MLSPGITGRGQIFWGPVDGGTEGPERGAKRRSAEGGLGRGAVAHPSMGVWGLCPQKIFQKINVGIAYFSAFLQAEMVFSAVAARQY